MQDPDFTPTTFDKEQLLRFLFYHMQPDQRFALMRELPGAYNRYVGAECAVVGRKCDNPRLVKV